MIRSLSLIALLTIAGSASANLIVNGDFEADAPSNIAVGGSGLTGWTVTGVTGQNVSLLPAGYLGQPTQQLDLSGVSDTAGSGISQNVATTLGTPYVLSFQAWTGDATYSGAFDVKVNGSTVLSVVDGLNGIQNYSLTFSATGPTTTISFVETIGGLTSHVDNVNLQAVPEPASMAVLGLGLAAFRRRRQAR